MRTRGGKYWGWADPALHSRSHEEAFADGRTIDVQVRLSRTGATQLFIGVYSTSGMAIYEEAYDSRPNESMSRALAWGVETARRIAEQKAVRSPLRALNV
ncbi:hypothetical protein [Pseudomonas sp. GZD-222]|uniref:hypothetical protein n=1 Tax=Pseudomonas sp. GZD-222 TaxID=3404805 RepID=UPI003BB7DA1B